ncbi:DUF3862 domain-containing protein [Paenibacillus sp. sgz302251]|uniref:DUF3862 domain-containing protein n=1 Tax=Paenibacillus sp. sgz302251 TaxID=3414493 RepID=UPI003C7D5D4F
MKKIALTLLVLGVILLTACGGTEPTGVSTNESKNSPEITKEEFDQIKDGMTYEEIVGIIGGEGELTVESGTEGEELHTAAYQFEGKGSIGANAQLMFQGGKLITKAQVGLK